MRLIEKIKSVFKRKQAVQRDGLYQIIGGHITHIDDNPRNYVTKGYQGNDLIYSIINLIAEKIKLPSWDEYEIKDEAALKTYISLTSKKDLSPKDYCDAKIFKRKALERVTEKTKLSGLLQYPNDTETFGEFVAAGSIFKLLTGNRFVWADLLSEGANRGLPNSLNNLPAHLVGIEVGRVVGKPLVVVTGYRFDSIGLMKIAKEQILHDRYFNPDWDMSGRHLYGQSPIRAALNRLARNNSAAKSQAATFENQGVHGIIYVDEPAYQPAERGMEAREIKKILTKEWTGIKNAGKLAASGYKIGFTQVGYTPVEMAVLESELHDLRFFCNLFGGVPSQLLNDPANKVYNNAKEGEVAFTLRSVMPLLVSFREQLNRKLITDWGYAGKNRYVDFDQTVFTELDEDIKERIEWVNKIRGISPNARLELLNLETIDNPLFDEPFITDDMGTPLSEWQMSEIDKILSDEKIFDKSNGLPKVSGDKEGASLRY